MKNADSNKTNCITDLDKRRLLYTINAHANLEYFDFRFEDNLSTHLDQVVSFESIKHPSTRHCTEFGDLLISVVESDTFDCWLYIETKNKLIGYYFEDYHVITAERSVLIDALTTILNLETNSLIEEKWSSVTISIKSNYQYSNILSDIRGPFGNLTIESTNDGRLKVSIDIPPQSVRGDTRIISAILSDESDYSTELRQFINENGRHPLMFLSF